MSKKLFTLLFVMLMLCGAAAGTALMRGDLAAIRRAAYALPGMLPFLALSNMRLSLIHI